MVDRIDWTYLVAAGNPVRDAIDKWCEEHLKDAVVCGHRFPVVIVDGMPPDEVVMTNGRESVTALFTDVEVDVVDRIDMVDDGGGLGLRRMK